MTLWTRVGRAVRQPVETLRVLHGRWQGGGRHEMVGRPDLWKAKRRFQIEFLRSQGLTPRHHLLDLGCGTLRGGIALIEYLDAGRYVGVEVRAEALEEGRRELEEAGLTSKQPRLVQCDDLGALSLDVRFDYVWAFSVLIHMTDEILDTAVGLAARHLRPDGMFLANVNVGEEGQPARWGEFPVMRHPWEFYWELAHRHGLRVTDLGALHELGDPERTRLAPESRRMLRFEPAGS